MTRCAPRFSVAAALAGIAAFAVPSALAGSATWPSLGTPPAVSGSAAAAGAKDVALLVAIEQYQDSDLPPVVGARQNLADWKAWLRARGVPTVVTLVDSQALKSEILAKAEAVAAKAQAGGKMWVLFIGHGSPSEQGDDGLLLTYNAVQSASGIEDFSVSRAALLDAVQSGKQSQSIVVLDACFSGRTAAGDLLTGLAPMRSVDEAIGGPVTLLTAAHSNQYAGTLPGGSRMAFSYLLLGALERGWGDENNDGKVMASEAVSWIDGAFLQVVKGRTQSPVFDGPDLVLGGGSEKLDLDAFIEVVPRSGAVVDPGSAVEPRMSGTQFGGGSGQSVSAKLARQKCDDAARGEADAAHAKKLAAAVAKVQASATARWKAMEPDATACLELRATADRESCAKELDSFASTGRTAKASLTAHTEVIDTACGSIERAFEAETVAVSVPEVAKAEAVAAKLRVAPAASASLSLSASSAGYSGQDWTSPTVGLMKYIPAGTFMMGSPESEAGHREDEVQHKVTLTRPFLLMEHEVTQREWLAVMGSNPSKFSNCGTTCPVEQVSWDDAQVFITKVSARDGVKYRLPTEAEWEYAARGGQSYVYAGSSEIGDVAWYDDNSGNTTHRVCQKARNGLGLCDMTGNVWEWTQDWYGAYANGSATDPGGASAGSYRVFRGGSWGNSPADARVASGPGSPRTPVGLSLGLRLARAL